MSLLNLVKKLTEDQRKSLVRKVIEDYESDLDSRRPWDTMHAEWLRLYYQADKPLNPAWLGASEETMPLLVEACTQFHARAYKAMFPNQNIITATPALGNTKELADRAKRVGQHMSWQLMVRDRYYKADKDKLLLGVALHGSYFTKTYFDPMLGRNVVENVRPEDLIIPYTVGQVDIDQVERKTQRIWMTENDGKIRAGAGFFSAVPKSYSLPPDQDKTQQHIDKSQGLTAPINLGLCLVLEQHCVWDMDEKGVATPYIVWVDRESQALLRVSPRYDTDEQGNPTDGMRPVEYFTHYCYMNNPEGFYGLGMGHLIGPLNKAVNKLVRQHIDAGTLANIGNASGFISSQLANVRGGEIQIELGKYRKIEASAEDLQKGLYTFRFPGPHPSTAQMIELIMTRSDRLATVTEALTGQMGKVVQPTAIMALIEQGLEVFSAVYERILTSWQSELQKYYVLNSKYLPDTQAYAVLNPDGTVDPAQVEKADYQLDLMVRPIADPKMTTKEQRLAKAQAEFQTNINNPMVQQSPPHLYMTFHRYYEAMEIPNIDEILPKPNTEPERVDDPVQENMGALLPMPHVPPVHIDQDHAKHIQAHDELLMAKMSDGGKHDAMSGYRETMKPEQVKALEDHRQTHVAMMYGVHEAGMLKHVMGDGPRNAALPPADQGGMVH